MDFAVKTRRYLKERLQKDAVTFYGFENERAELKNLFMRTAKEGESNSAILVSQKGGGKTTLVNSVLYELLLNESFVSNTLIILLNGLIQVDDRQALKSITRQMKLDNQVIGKVFKSFSENLSFLLSCLKTGKDTKRLIFVIDEFDLFCAHHKQTLLYNLFDVAQSAQTPICVLGVTSRFDAVELLEKRVKSRFSHRQILLLPDSGNFKKFLHILTELLLLPTTNDLKNYEVENSSLSTKILEDLNLPFLRRTTDLIDYEFPESHVNKWNLHIQKLVANEKVGKALEQFFETNFSIKTLKFLLFQLVMRINEKSKTLNPNDFIRLCDNLIREDDRVQQMKGLSVLEMCLLIAIKHHCDIYDNDPFNFEMIFTRFNKFAVKCTTMQGIEREMILKRFENLKYQELIVSTCAGGREVQKEYQMHKMVILADQIDRAIQAYRNLPTEIEQWSKSSII